MSPFVIYEILSLFVDILTADEKYSVSNRKRLSKK